MSKNGTFMRHAQLTTRITIGLLAIVLSVLLIASLLGLLPQSSFASPNWLNAVWNPQIRFLLFCLSALFAAYYCFIQRSLTQWDPSRAIPERVQSALNTLSEGVIVLDESESLVLVNSSFAKMHGKTSEDLVGLPVSMLRWIAPGEEREIKFPWRTSLRTGAEQHDCRIGLHVGDAEPKIFRVNTTPIRDEEGRLAGAMATFVDLTSMERGRQALCDILRDLSESREDIKRQNQELQVLAMFDPLTNCLNRRAFFERFETHWKSAERYHVPLSCLMLDLDHFKDINDKYGHDQGDLVLKRVGQVITKTARETDVVCRYGGEEFCVLMPHTSLEQADLAAQRLHAAIAACEFEHFQITASIGVAEKTGESKEPHELLKQADRCLYVAKNSGRNRIVLNEAMIAALPEALIHASVLDDSETSIPYHAVTALFSALSFRNATTAEHSRRVADLCMLAGDGLLSHRELYILEVAALLHDIGKMGVPDMILLKPGALTPEEREIMSSQARMGVEILRSAFSCPQLTEIVRLHTLWFSGDVDYTPLPSGEAIPVSARLLTICDAYESMTTPRVYRAARSQAEAIAELEKFAGTQFDPALVKHFVRVIQEHATQREMSLEAVSKATALNIGLEIQRLAEMIDTQDIGGVRSIAGRLKSLAQKEGIQEIAQVSSQLEVEAHQQTDLTILLSTVRELLNLCRSTQKVYLMGRRAGEAVEPAHM
jgi:diguanylate cyclase (GGDEF)-like protein/PAS domain S-box-containing protein